jgi:hypothetical protein
MALSHFYCVTYNLPFGKCLVFCANGTEPWCFPAVRVLCFPLLSLVSGVMVQNMRRHDTESACHDVD